LRARDTSDILEYQPIKLHKYLASKAPSPEYTSSGDYRSSGADGSTKGRQYRLTVAWIIGKTVARNELQINDIPVDTCRQWGARGKRENTE
jgi:hypothetical protein